MIPAIDILRGRCVRLLHGDFQQETVYSGDPIAVASAHTAAGARRLHVVDLDAARGTGDNRNTIARIAAGAVEVQVAGGIRSPADVSTWLDIGAAAVVVGTAAIREPRLLTRCAASHKGRVLAALDLKEDRPAVTGWSQTEPVSVATVLAAWEDAELAGVILTSIERDGTLAGPDLAMLALVRTMTRHPVTYSGGIRSLDDLRAVAAGGASGAIVGKALYEGWIDLQAALSSPL